MKVSSNRLFELIKSLTPQEKIYFKTYSKNGSADIQYLKLFDLLNKQEVYDEKEIRAKIGDKTAARNLKHTKSRLTEALLKSLTLYNSDFSVEMQIQNLLQQAEMLSSRRLFDFAFKIVEKAEVLANKHEKYEYLILIFFMKTWSALKVTDLKTMQANSKPEILKENEYLRQLENSVLYRSLLLRTSLIYNVRPNIQEKNVLNEMRSIFKSPLLSSPKKALSFSARRDYNFLHIMRAEVLEKWDNKLLVAQKDWVESMEKDPALLIKREADYLTDLRRLISIQLKLGKTTEIERTFNKATAFYKSLPGKARTLDIKLRMLSLTANYMAAHIEFGNLQVVVNSWNSVRKMIPESMINFEAMLVIYSNLFYVYFAKQDFHEALNYLNKILNVKVSNRLDIQANARVGLLLVHYELGNYEMLPYFVKSSYRWLMKNNYADDFVKTFLKFFQKNINTVLTRREETIIFTQFKKELLPLFEKTEAQSLARHMDYIAWLDSKIMNKPFFDIVNAKINQE